MSRPLGHQATAYASPSLQHFVYNERDGQLVGYCHHYTHGVVKKITKMHYLKVSLSHQHSPSLRKRCKVNACQIHLLSHRSLSSALNNGGLSLLISVSVQRVSTKASTPIFLGPVYFSIAGMPATLVENHPARRARGGRARICRSSRVVTFDDDRGWGAGAADAGGEIVAVGDPAGR